MKIAIIDYGSGNLRSAQKAFERAAFEGGTAAEVVVTSDPDTVRFSDRIVLPGVGAFRDCRRGIQVINGMDEVLHEQVLEKSKPFFGICVGMQLMADRGLEGKETSGFGWIGGQVEKISVSDPALKIPHMGWNTLNVSNQHPLLDGITTGDNGLHAYFVHSYQFHTDRADDMVATANYGVPVTAMIAKENMVGTQFHPEKSQKLGLAMISNFLKWAP